MLNKKVLLLYLKNLKKMKKLILIAFLLVGITSFAQEKMEGQNRMSPEQRDQMRVKKLTAELNLTSAQQQQMSEIIAHQSKKREEFRAQRKENKEGGMKPSPEQRVAMKEQMEKEKQEFDAKMKGILTPQQYEKYVIMKDEKRAEVKEKMQERKNNFQPAGNK